MEINYMKRYWWMTDKEKERMMPQVKRRGPYQKGGKEYLSSFEVGEVREFDYSLKWNSLRGIASHMAKDYGCRFSFRTIKGKRFITRTL